jgi:hypothetical protein
MAEKTTVQFEVEEGAKVTIGGKEYVARGGKLVEPVKLMVGHTYRITHRDGGHCLNNLIDLVGSGVSGVMFKDIAGYSHFDGISASIEALEDRMRDDAEWTIEDLGETSDLIREALAAREKKGAE